MTPGQTPQARKARNDLWTAIWQGRVTPAERCEKCNGRPVFLDKIQAHHDDYSKPLDVRWLCRSCHIKHHVALRKAEGTYNPGGRRRAA